MTTPRDLANRERDAYATYVDRRQAARDAYEAEVRAADAWWAGVVDSLNSLRGHGASEERAES